LDPLKGKVHIDQAGVEHTILVHVVPAQETESSKAVVNGDGDKRIVISFDEWSGIETRCREEVVATAV